MEILCVICCGAGTLRDGGACPACRTGFQAHDNRDRLGEPLTSARDTDRIKYRTLTGRPYDSEDRSPAPARRTSSR